MVPFLLFFCSLRSLFFLYHQMILTMCMNTLTLVFLFFPPLVSYQYQHFNVYVRAFFCIFVCHRHRLFYVFVTTFYLPLCVRHTIEVRLPYYVKALCSLMWGIGAECCRFIRRLIFSNILLFKFGCTVCRTKASSGCSLAQGVRVNCSCTT